MKSLDAEQSDLKRKMKFSDTELVLLEETNQRIVELREMNVNISCLYQ